MKKADPASTAGKLPVAEGGTEAQLVARAIANDPSAIQAIMRMYNQRLFRIARGVVRDDGIAEDVLQEAYVKAFRHLDRFRAESALSTWLYRIVINEALGRLRKSSGVIEVRLPVRGTSAEVVMFPNAVAPDDPEKTMAQRQILHLVEEATDGLPDKFRLVFIARVIEGMSVEETAELLDLKAETVRTRLHRARELLRKHIDRRIGPVLLNAFPFAGRRCERFTAEVLARLGHDL